MAGWSDILSPPWFYRWRGPVSVVLPVFSCIFSCSVFLLSSYSQILLRKNSNAWRGVPLMFGSLALPFGAAWLQVVRLHVKKAALLPHQNGALTICGRWGKVLSGLQITAFLFLPSVLVPHLTASGWTVQSHFHLDKHWLLRSKLIYPISVSTEEGQKEK